MPLYSISIRGGVPWGSRRGTTAERVGVVVAASARPPTVVTLADTLILSVVTLVTLLITLTTFFTPLTSYFTISLTV